MFNTLFNKLLETGHLSLLFGDPLRQLVDLGDLKNLLLQFTLVSILNS